MIFCFNLIAMFFNTLTFSIVGDRAPTREFLLSLIVLTLGCQLFLYVRLMLDISYILKIRIFFVKKPEPAKEETDLESRDQQTPGKAEEATN